MIHRAPARRESPWACGREEDSLAHKRVTRDLSQNAIGREYSRPMRSVARVWPTQGVSVPGSVGVTVGPPTADSQS